ncbi:putative translation initiation factor IF2/IF5 [Helianthus annuus]|nr:putative translation initiation factor IF2/IF5 [Helianthus annuus]
MMQFAPVDPMKTKKKKKVIQQLVDDTGHLYSENLEPSFTGLKKKKKKQVDAESEDVDAEEDINDPEKPLEGTDRDFKYEELLSRVFHFLRESNPELAGEKRKTILKIPEVLREGTKKTVFVNLVDICKMMRRQPEHVMTFLLAELGTSGSLDGQQRLVVKGRFAPKSFQGILRRYMSNLPIQIMILFALLVSLEAKALIIFPFYSDDYVICNSCKGRDTRIEKDKDNRLTFLNCDEVPPTPTFMFIPDRTCFFLFACQIGSGFVGRVITLIFE